MGRVDDQIKEKGDFIDNPTLEQVNSIFIVGESAVEVPKMSKRGRERSINTWYTDFRDLQKSGKFKRKKK